MPIGLQKYGYSDDYKESCFYIWYKNGRPKLGARNGSKIIPLMPFDETGSRPTLVTIKTWMTNDNWEQRADALDAQVSIRLDEEAIASRIDTLRTLAQNGRDLKDKGLGYLKSKDSPFENNPSAAVRAIVAGSEMEFKYAGAADMLANIAGMSDRQLDKELARLLGKNENEIIEAETEDATTDTEEEDGTETDND
jgi:hypothetical protein